MNCLADFEQQHLISNWVSSHPFHYRAALESGFTLQVIQGNVWVLGEGVEMTATLFVAITNQNMKGVHNDKSDSN